MLGVSPLKRTTLPVANKTNGDRMAKKKEAQEESLEKQLWKSADKLRKNIDAAEYKHVVLGLIFL
jgi:type I restriction-modification system DNA methylase subunit